MLSVCRTAVLQYLQSVSQHCMHLGMLQDRIDVQTDPCNAVLAGIYISVECMQYLVLCTIVGALQFCLSWRQPAARLQQSQVPNCSTRPHCRPGLQQSWLVSPMTNMQWYIKVTTHDTVIQHVSISALCHAPQSRKFALCSSHRSWHTFGRGKHASTPGGLQILGSSNYRRPKLNLFGDPWDPASWKASNWPTNASKICTLSLANGSGFSTSTISQ